MQVTFPLTAWKGLPLDGNRDNSRLIQEIQIVHASGKNTRECQLDRRTVLKYVELKPPLSNRRPGDQLNDGYLEEVFWLEQSGHPIHLLILDVGNEGTFPSVRTQLHAKRKEQKNGVAPHHFRLKQRIRR